MNRLFFSSFAAGFLFLSLGTPLLLSQETSFPPVPSASTVAHRGFSFAAPENTISSVLKAIEIGAEGCEFDVYSTSDGLLYLTHDGNLKRTTGFDRASKLATSAELAQLEFGSWFGDRQEFKGEKLATYDEALALLKYTACRPVVEVKESGFEEKIVAGLRRFDLIETAIVIDFSEERVKKIRELAPNLCVAWLCSFKVENETPESMAQKIIATLKECNTNVVDVQYSAISPEFLKILNDANVRVMCWTVDNPADIERLLGWGVESITTNRPDLVIEARRRLEAEKASTIEK